MTRRKIGQLWQVNPDEDTTYQGETYLIMGRGEKNKWEVWVYSVAGNHKCLWKTVHMKHDTLLADVEKSNG